MDISALIPALGGLAWTIFFFAVALGAVVAVHEYGHYVAGRWSGIHAEVFSIGFGPAIWSRADRRGTRWQVAALPLGGYVRFAGDAGAAPGGGGDAAGAAGPAASRRTMRGAPLWARAATVAAGPASNFALSVLVFAVVGYSSGVPRDPLTVGEVHALPSGAQGLREGDVLLEIDGAPVPGADDPAHAAFMDGLPLAAELDYTVERGGERVVVRGPYPRPPLVRSVSPRSAALAAGLERGDVVTSVDGEPILAFRQLADAVEGSGGAALELGVWRDGAILEMSLAPRRVDEPRAGGGFATRWRIGVASGNAFEPASVAPGVLDAAAGGAVLTWRVAAGAISGLGHMVTGAISTCNLSGPIGIAQASGAMASQGAQSFAWFVAVLSTAVGLLNLFPIPALDGGHLAVCAYEAAVGRPPSDGALRVLTAVGLALVLALMLFALGNDLLCP